MDSACQGRNRKLLGLYLVSLNLDLTSDSPYWHVSLCAHSLPPNIKPDISVQTLKDYVTPTRVELSESSVTHVHGTPAKESTVLDSLRLNKRVSGIAGVFRNLMMTKGNESS